MSFELTGKIEDVGPVEQITEKFKKRELVLVVVDNPTYPEYVKLEAHQDKVNLFDNVYPGDDVTVSFNIKGKKWVNQKGETQIFNSLVAWRVNKNTQGATKPSGNTNAPKSNYSAPQAPEMDDDGSDLPW